MKRKKQGASLIFVIIIFMFISIVSTGMLSMIAGNYKARVVESKRVENLYASDSGLDVAYNVIGKTFDAATKYGHWKMEALKNGSNTGPNNIKYKNIEEDIEFLKNDIDNLEASKNADGSNVRGINKSIAKIRGLIEEDEEMQEILLNEEFKRAFKNFIARTSEVTDDENVPEKRLEDSMEAIEGPKYVSEVNADNIDTKKPEEIIEFGFEDKNGDPVPPPKLEAKVDIDENVVEDSNEEKGISTEDGHYKTVEFTVHGDQEYYDITVTSTFHTEKVNENDDDKKPINERQLQVRYRMLVPDYKDIFFENATGDLNEYLALKDRALTIGGDMEVNEADKLIVNGNVFVQGNDNEDDITDNRVYGKYVGGIILDSSDEVLFNDNVITRGTFNIQNNTNAEIKGDLYARNIYAGALDGDYSDNSNLTAEKEVVIDNDLALKATDTHITITDFYGINDKNISYKNNSGYKINNGNSNENDKARTSSSIIINGYTDPDGIKNSSSVRITDKAYIMGTAHIATVGNYQTGESTAVKDKDKVNYEAYSVPLNEAEKFDYYDPLQLLDESNVFTKGEHFKAYWNEMNPNKVDRGGINFDYPDNDHIHSVGAVVIYDSDKNENVVISATYDLEDDGDITEKRLDYASKVYKFEQDPDIEDYDSLGEDAITVQSLMDFSEELPSDYDLDDEIDSDGEKAIFNSYAGKTIVIKGQYNTGDYDDKDKYIIIDASSNEEVNAVIATLGSVIIDGDVTFNGSIIANGNLTITGDVTINYDKDIVERVQAENIELFNNVFGDNIIEIEESEENTDPDAEGTDVLATKYDLKSFLENKLWKILK